MAVLSRNYVKPHIGRFIGPFPSLPGPVATSRIVLARAPRGGTPRPHLTPVVIAPSAAPVAKSTIVMARQSRLALIRPHVTRILGPQPPPSPVSTSLLFRAKQPTVFRPKPHLQAFTGYAPAVAPVSRSLLVRVRYRVAATHTLANSVSVLRLPVPPANTAQNWSWWPGGAWMA